MEDMALCFLRLMEITNSKKNYACHKDGLNKLIVNFGNLYSIVEDGLLKQEADILTYSLHLRLNKFYKKMSAQQIKFYKYYFKGQKKPIIMETYSKVKADEMLSLLSERSGVHIDLSLLEDFKIEMPLTGISKRIRFGKTYIWVGSNHSVDGWMLNDEYLKKVEGND